MCKMNIYDGTHRRLMLKTLSYRIVGAVITVLIVFTFTGRLALCRHRGGKPNGENKSLLFT